MPKLQESSANGIPAPKKAAPKAKPKPPQQKAPSTPRPIVYAERQSVLCVGEKVITEDKAKRILKWETEDEFIARKQAESKDFTDEICKKLFREPDEWGALAFVIKDFEGKWVRCWCNWGNRPFDENHMMGFAQTILSRMWADSRNGPDMTDNGEALILSKTARVDSGQHRLIGIIFAVQQWRKNPKKYPQWTEAPSIEALLSVGVSDNPAVTQTQDNVKPRSVSDNLMTSPHFQKNPDGSPMDQSQRRECTRMLERAIEFSMRRLDVGGYKTNQAALEFLDRHPTLEKLVRHLFDENKNRGISLLRLSAGQMAGVAYLMATSASDRDKYRNKLEEKAVDLSRLDLAMDFFVMLASKHDQFVAIHDTIALLVGDENLEGGSRSTEKLAILSKAWAAYVMNPKAKITKAQIALSYWTDEEGLTKLKADETGYLNYFGGVDTGEKVKKTSTDDNPTGEEAPAPKNDEGKPKPKMAKDLTPSEMDKAKEQVQKDRAAKAQAVLNNRKALGDKAGAKSTPKVATQPTKPTAPALSKGEGSLQGK